MISHVDLVASQCVIRSSACHRSGPPVAKGKSKGKGANRWLLRDDVTTHLAGIREARESSGESRRSKAGGHGLAHGQECYAFCVAAKAKRTLLSSHVSNLHCNLIFLQRATCGSFCKCWLPLAAFSKDLLFTDAGQSRRPFRTVSTTTYQARPPGSYCRARQKADVECTG